MTDKTEAFQLGVSLSLDDLIQDKEVELLNAFARDLIQLLLQDEAES